MLTYDEPVPGLDENGNEVTCNRRVGMTPEDAIKHQRFVARMSAWRKDRAAKILTPEELLDEYKVVHWATEEK